MTIPSIISGSEILHNPFRVESPFYPGAGYEVAAAGPLDVAAAIGSARKARPASIEERIAMLERAAHAFTYTPADLERAVWVTGMPIAQIKALFDEIPQWFLDVPRLISGNIAPHNGLDSAQGVSTEILNNAIIRRFSPLEGFCYAVTPGNDPRAAALVAANLACYGIPFIIRASPKDTTAPLVIRALLQAGLDQNSCSLLYSAPQAGSAFHERLIEASRMVWTHGPVSFVDSRLRYAASSQNSSQDRFQGKLVIRHNSGCSAVIIRPPLDQPSLAVLYQSLAYPLGCATARSILAVGDLDGEKSLAGWLASLRVGDPLDPSTQVGYIESGVLDQVEQLVHRSLLRANFWGGERISAIQATPLLAASQEVVPYLFAHEIPAYVVALRRCSAIDEAVDQINQYTGEEPRLSISCHHLATAEFDYVVGRARAHAVLNEKPTTMTLPVFHEGNDYFQLLHRQKIVA